MKTILVLATSILLTAAPVMAQRGPGAPKPTTSHGASAPKTTTSHGASAPKPTTSHGAQAPKTTHGSTPKAGTTSHGSGHGAKTTTSGSSVKTTTKTTKTTTTTTVAPTTTLSPVQLKLQKNTNLASKLQSRLPAGTNLTLAAADFRNLGQFVAAVNVSNNLGIPFTELKTRMVDQGMSLGQAIQDARPKTTDTTLVVRRAETDADVLIRTTEQQTTTVTKTKKAKKSTSGGK
jgi:hypothetical protein